MVDSMLVYLSCTFFVVFFGVDYLAIFLGPYMHMFMAVRTSSRVRAAISRARCEPSSST